MRRRIEGAFRFIKACCQHRPIAHNDAPDLPRTRLRQPLAGLLKSQAHKSLVFAYLVHFAFLLAIPALLTAGIGGETSQAIRSVELDPAQSYRVRDLQFTRGDVQFFLTDGYLTFSKPVLGAPVAAVFSSLVDGGDAEFLLLPPDRDERRILSQHAGSGNLEEHLADAAFFFADDTATELMHQITRAGTVRNDPENGVKTAAKYNAALRRIMPQFETRLLLDLLTSPHTRDRLFAGFLGGKTLGGFNFVFDPRASEQVLVGKPKPGASAGDFDIWASYTPKSLLREVRPPDFHADRYRIDSQIEASLQMRVETAFTVTAITGNLHALSFDLSRQMTITRAEVDGQPAEISETPNVEIPGTDRGDRLFLIVPAQPLLAGTQHRVTVLHSGNVITSDPDHVYFVGSRGRWYPHRALEFARFDLKFRFPKTLDLVAPGETVLDTIEGNERVIEHRVDTPIPMAGFNLGSYTCKLLDQPAFTVEMCSVQPTGAADQSSVSNSVLAAKVASVMNFYSERFGPPPLHKLVISPIPGKFGQGFGGLIYLSTMAYMSPSGKAFSEMNQQSQLFFTELMQAHEVAHQWWGNLVLTAGYHDEWITEALANYSAMLYIQAQSGPEPVKVLLDAYRSGLLEKTSDGSELEQAGPVTQALRIDVEGKPSAWVTILYGKGTWIMQMLHARMGDANFWKMLAELRRRYERKNLTTGQFRELCASFMPPGVPDPQLLGFFDQWVYGMGIPRLKLASAIKGGPGGFRLTGTLSQSGVADDFSADFPVQIEAHGKKFIKWLESSSEPVSFNMSLPARPDRVALDPDNQFLQR